MSETNLGRTHVYFGDGKGKTTAAVGLAIRAAGYGLNVVFVQFLKGRKTGETGPLEKLGVQVIRSEKTTRFTWEMTDEQRKEYGDIQAELLDAAKEAVQAVKAVQAEQAVQDKEQVDLLVLDEALNATSCGLLDDEMLKDFVLTKPESLELVLTGRPLPDWLVERADYITEMKKHKHPFDSGVDARKAIEF
jgi:cob(I)alamin adenosyltransferase